jgi:AraC family transcriptional regulator of adaptative response / DNA-3-methyladenine glycosylase II
MRVFGDPDAFPDGDLGVRRGAEAIGLPADGRALAAHARRWRPWRAYAVQHLWAATPHEINHWPPVGEAESAPAAAAPLARAA